MDDAIKTTRKYISKLKKGGLDVKSAFLFGSFARGTQNKDSDIDVCVISSSFGKDYFADMVKLRTMTYDIDYRIEPIPLTPDDLKDPYSSLSTEIRNYGVKVI
ncbi:MAG: nucleotidyltransferase domain-containing protein [Patescibacteria group bacterium]